MPPSPDDPSVFDEPHMRPLPPETGPSQAHPQPDPRKSGDSVESLTADGQSIYEEPDIFPNRPPEVIEQDWTCSQCGYNLRGLAVGHLCPECGHRELYRPAPAGSRSYRTWLESRLAATSPSTGWYIALLAALLGGPLAILGAFFQGREDGLAGLSVLLLAVVFGPTAEETLKIAAAACVVEVRPYLFRRAGQIWFAAVGTAFVFAGIENFIYLNIYVPNPGVMLVLWRWTACVALHVGCTATACAGLVQVWSQSVNELRPPRISGGLKNLVAAIVLHGTYNGLVALWQAVSGRF
jgi:predicted RNA-binding Zn-ribbon protein involved in translation (DUF1610 family)